MPLYLVETQTIRRQYYVIESDDRPNGRCIEDIQDGHYRQLGEVKVGGQHMVGLDTIAQDRAIKLYKECGPASDPNLLSQNEILKYIMNKEIKKI